MTNDSQEEALCYAHIGLLNSYTGILGNHFISWTLMFMNFLV